MDLLVLGGQRRADLLGIHGRNRRVADDERLTGAWKIRIAARPADQTRAYGNGVAAFAKVNAVVDVYDPWVDADEAVHEYGIRPSAAPQHGSYDAIIIAVAHEQFKALGAAGIRAFGKSDSIIYDVKYVLPRDAVDGRL